MTDELRGARTMNEPRIWPNSPEEEHRLRQDIAARATQDSSEPDAAKELVKAIRRARHDGVKLVAAHDAALIAKTLAERSIAKVEAEVFHQHHVHCSCFSTKPGGFVNEETISQGGPEQAVVNPDGWNPPPSRR